VADEVVYGTSARWSGKRDRCTFCSWAKCGSEIFGLSYRYVRGGEHFHSAIVGGLGRENQSGVVIGKNMRAWGLKVALNGASADVGTFGRLIQ
jgi:hypothetical protein